MEKGGRAASSVGCGLCTDVLSTPAQWFILSGLGERDVSYHHLKPGDSLAGSDSDTEGV